MMISNIYKVIDDDNSTPTIVILRIPQNEMDGLLSRYDENSPTSPSEVDSRNFLRQILDAAKEISD